jgi:hypothetical protein
VVKLVAQASWMDFSSTFSESGAVRLLGGPKGPPASPVLYAVAAA